MAPRRGGSGGYSYFSNSSPWAEEISFSMTAYESRSLFITGFAFDVLFALSLIGFLTWSCLIRNQNGQMKGVVVAIVTWLLFQITAIVYEILFIAEAVVTQYYNIDLMLEVFFSNLSIWMIAFVFYNLIHRLLRRLTDSGNPYAALEIVHWVILGILGAISVAAWAMYVVFRVGVVQGSIPRLMTLAKDMNKVDSARVLLFFVVSVEIFAWLVFAAIKAGSHRFTSRAPIYAIIAGSVCFFATCTMNAVIYIRYYIEAVAYVPDYLTTVTSILQFFFGVGTLVGILAGCQKWRHIDNSMDKPQVTTVQYPYGNAPYQPQPYPGYEQQFQQPMQTYQHPISPK